MSKTSSFNSSPLSLLVGVVTLFHFLSHTPPLYAFTPISSRFHYKIAGNIINDKQKSLTKASERYCNYEQWQERSISSCWIKKGHQRRRDRMPNLSTISTTRIFVGDVTMGEKEEEDITNKESISSSSSSCPFSMNFPRYRINLTSKREINDIETNNSGGGLASLIPNPFSSIQGTMNRFQLESKYKENVRLGSFHWMDCSSSTTAAAAAVDNKDKNVVLTQAYKKAAINLRAASFFWRQVSNLLLSSKGQNDEMVLAFSGGTSKICICRLIDILDWYNEQTVDGTLPAFFVDDGTQDEKKAKSMLVVKASLDEEVSLPTVILTTSTTTSATNTNSVSYPLDGIETNENRCNNNNVDEETSAVIVQERIQSWVRRLLVDLGICPFTKSDKRSGQGLGDLGVPVGKIAYHYSNANVDCIPLLMADAWTAISEMIDAGPSGRNGISSILLAAPTFDTNFPLWAGPVFAMLESGVSATNSEPAIGVVCFHPQYATPDGSSWPGFGHMHSVPRLRKWLEERNPNLSEMLSEEEVAAGGAWQRRTPHAVINVLRAEQLEVAEGRRATGVLYAENIRVLIGNEGVGSSKLAADLMEEQQMGSNKGDQG